MGCYPYQVKCCTIPAQSQHKLTLAPWLEMLATTPKNEAIPNISSRPEANRTWPSSFSGIFPTTISVQEPFTSRPPEHAKQRLSASAPVRFQPRELPQRVMQDSPLNTSLQVCRDRAPKGTQGHLKRGMLVKTSKFSSSRSAAEDFFGVCNATMEDIGSKFSCSCSIWMQCKLHDLI